MLHKSVGALRASHKVGCFHIGEFWKGPDGHTYDVISANGGMVKLKMVIPNPKVPVVIVKHERAEHGWKKLL